MRGCCSRFTFSLIPGALLVGCAGLIPPPTDADALRASARWPGTTVGALTEARRLYIDHCSGCHNLYTPASHPADKWPKLVANMAVRAKVDNRQLDRIALYLTVMAETSPPP